MRYRYGRLLTALALVAGGVAIGLSAEPRGVTAASAPEPVPAVAKTPELARKAPSPGSISSFQSVLRFGEICVVYTYHPDVDRSCWSVHDITGNVLGIYADQRALETFFPDVDTSELFYAAIRNTSRGH